MMQCEKCGMNPSEIKCILVRIHPKGEAGVWQCYPRCGTKLSLSQRLDAALALNQDFDDRETESYQ